MASALWAASKAKRAAARVGKPPQPRDEHGNIVTRAPDGTLGLRFDTVMARDAARAAATT
jgi:hypothetical protein